MGVDVGPRSWTKDKGRVIAATQTGNRRGTLQGGGWVGAEEKGAISQAKLLLGWRREKYHSNNGAKDDRRNGEGGGVGGREKEGGPKQKLNYQSLQTCMLS